MRSRKKPWYGKKNMVWKKSSYTYIKNYSCSRSADIWCMTIVSFPQTRVPPPVMLWYTSSCMVSPATNRVISELEHRAASREEPGTVMKAYCPKRLLFLQIPMFRMPVPFGTHEVPQEIWYKPSAGIVRTVGVPEKDQFDPVIWEDHVIGVHEPLVMVWLLLPGNVTTV